MTTDWRSQQIGLGVERCPGDNDNVDALIDRDLIDAYKRKLVADYLQGPPPNGTAILAARPSPMVGELGRRESRIREAIHRFRR